MNSRSDDKGDAGERRPCVEQTAMELLVGANDTPVNNDPVALKLVLLRDPECKRCDHSGYWVEEDVRSCGKHFTADERALWDACERRSRAIGVGVDGWPYGPNISLLTRVRMLDWAEHHGLRLSRKRGFNLPDGPRNWCDHVTYWNGPGGVRVMVSQPYGLAPEEAAWLRGLAGVRVEIRSENSWYGGGTTYIALWRDRA